MTDNLAIWLIAQLEKKGWSTRELARRAELSHTTINNVINDRAQPGLNFCLNIARALRVPPEDVLRRARLLPPINPEAQQNARLLHYFTALPPEERQRILLIACAFYEEYTSNE